jgi:hypothetical protein
MKMIISITFIFAFLICVSKYLKTQVHIIQRVFKVLRITTSFNRLFADDRFDDNNVLFFPVAYFTLG